METIGLILFGLVLLGLIIWQGKDFSMNTYRISYVYDNRKLLAIDVVSKSIRSATNEALLILRKRSDLSNNKKLFVWISSDLINEQLSYRGA